MSTIPNSQELELFAETLPYFLASAVFQIDRFLNGENTSEDAKALAENSRKMAISSLRIYKKNLISFHHHPYHAFLVEYATSVYPGVIFSELNSICVLNKNYPAVLRKVNNLIEILENAKKHN